MQRAKGPKRPPPPQRDGPHPAGPGSGAPGGGGMEAPGDPAPGPVSHSTPAPGLTEPRNSSPSKQDILNTLDQFGDKQQQQFSNGTYEFTSVTQWRKARELLLFESQHRLSIRLLKQPEVVNVSGMGSFVLRRSEPCSVSQHLPIGLMCVHRKILVKQL